MRKQFVFIFLLVVIGNTLFAQKDTVAYTLGNQFFNEGKIAEAESLFTEAIKINPKRDYFFNRGISRLYLNDTSGFCSDMKYLKESNDFEATNLYKQNCFKQDPASYSYFEIALKEINRDNLVLAESLLSLSINENHFIENHFYRGLVRFSLGDTNGFCLDMRANYKLNDASKNNFDKYCRDIIYYDKSFLKISETKTPYYQIKYKPNAGAFYNENVKNPISLNSPFNDQYWFNEKVVGFYTVNENNEVFDLAEIKEKKIATKIKEFIDNKLVLDNETKTILKRNKLSNFRMALTFIISEKGEIIEVKSFLTDVLKNQINNMKDYDFVESRIIEKMNEIKNFAPKIDPACIGNRAVCYRTTLLISIKI